MRKISTIQNILIVFVLLVAVSGISIQAGLSWSGEWGTLNEDKTIEAEKLNVTQIYLSSVNITDPLTYPELPASYIIFKSGSTYYAKNGSTEQIDHSGSEASTVISDAWGNMPNGGTIQVKGTIDLSTNQLVMKLTKETKYLQLMGEGTSKTVFMYSGTGYAFNFTTDDSTLGGYDLYLNGFTVNGTTKTSGRNGILIEKLGRNVYVEKLYVLNFDIGVKLYNAPSNSFVDGIRVHNTNTGIELEAGGFGGPSQVYWENLLISSASNYGLYSPGGHSQTFKKGIFDSCGEAMWFGPVIDVNIEQIAFENNVNVDINVSGTNDANLAKNVEIKSCYFYSPSAPYAVKVYFAKNVVIREPWSDNHTTAFLWYDNRAQYITIENPIISNEYLLDGSPTMTISRSAVTVIEPRRIGVSARGAIATSEGDVLYLSGDASYTSWNPSGNEDNPAVVMYGQQSGKPMVIVVDGITKVNCTAAITGGDTLVVANGSGEYKLGMANNTQTDPKKIVGYAIETTGASGVVYAKIP